VCDVCCVCLEGVCVCVRVGAMCVCVLLFSFRFAGMRVGVLLIYFASVLCFFVESSSMLFSFFWLSSVQGVERFCVW